MFDFYKSQVEPNSPITLVMPTTATEKYEVGEALVLASGALTKAGATQKPQFISCAKYEAPVSDPKAIQVTKVNPDQIYRVPLSVAGADLKVGDKVTIATNGLEVTATTASGVAEILELEGTAKGSFVKVHF